MDKRVIQTKKDLKKSLTYLMEKTPYKDVSITDLTTLAKVNRSTFYTHYNNIEDLINEIEKDILCNMTSIISKSFYSTNLNRMLLELSNYVKQEKDFFKVVLSHNGDIGFIRKLSNELTTIFNHPKAEILNKIEDLELKKGVIIFLIGGILGLYKEWIAEDCQTSITQYAKKIEKLIGKLKESFV